MKMKLKDKYINAVNYVKINGKMWKVTAEQLKALAQNKKLDKNQMNTFFEEVKTVKKSNTNTANEK